MAEVKQQAEKPPVSKPTNPAKDVETTTPLAGLDVNSPIAAELMGQMQQELAELKDQVSSLKQAGGGGGDGVTESGPSGFPWQYYHRPDEGPHAGWVVYGPGGADPIKGQRDSGAFVHYMTKGQKPITGYGNCDAPSAYPLPGQAFVPMLERGGAREFPATQVLAHKWHINPPLAGVVFPEYEKVKDRVRHFECEDCDRFDMYMLDDDTETGMACFRHLRSDTQDGRHQYSRAEATAILKEQQVPFSSGRYAAVAAEIKRVQIQGNVDALQPSAKAEGVEA